MTTFARETHKIKLPIGSLGACFSEAATPDVWDFVITQTLKGKYESVAEYLVDLAIEESFNSK